MVPEEYKRGLSGYYLLGEKIDFLKSVKNQDLENY